MGNRWKVAASLVFLTCMAALYQNCDGFKTLEMNPTQDIPGFFSDDSRLEPVNKPGSCTLVFSNLINDTWENAAVFDPRTGDVVHFGGHVLGSYVQSGYTYLYNSKNKTQRRAPTARSGPRQCLVVGTYIDQLGMAAYVHGNVEHGSMGTGGFKDGYTRLGLTDNYGPFFYDSSAETFEYSRTLGKSYDRRHHANVAYEKTSDVMASISEDEFLLYHSRTNQVLGRKLPTALHNRSAYGIAADPVHRKFVVFGGSGPLNWVFVGGDRQTNYDLYVKNDTWIYDIASDTWKEVKNSVLNPPKGSPSSDFVNFPMIYEPTTGNILLRVNPLNKVVDSTSQWPDAETWAFNVETEQWSPVVLEGAPAFPGLMTYDSNDNQLMIVGGGRNPGSNPRPNLNRHFYVCSIPQLGFPLPKADPEQVHLSSNSSGHVTLSWNVSPGATYTIYRAQAQPVAGVLVPIAETSAGTFTDTDTTAGVVYVYQVGRGKLKVRALPVTNQPHRLSGLMASVENARVVNLRWNPSNDPEVMGYHVYRGRGEQGALGIGTKLTASPLTLAEFSDATVDLTDGVARFYWVKAVNRSGIESGASPWAATMPEAPFSVRAEKISTNQIKISWTYPNDLKVKGFQIYHVDQHMNTLSQTAEKVAEWYASWKPITTSPVTENEVIFEIPAGSTAPHHYFYVRAVNVLDQTGFFTDIISATDTRFVSHVQP